MKKSLYFAIGAIVGVGLGAGATYFYMVKKQSDTLAAVTDQLRDYYSNSPQKKVEVKMDNSEQEEDTPEVVHEKSCTSSEHFTQDRYKDYTKCRDVPFRVDTEVTENEDGELETKTLVKMGNEDECEPYSIPPEQFDADNGYQKIMLVWYEKDRVLAYDNNPRIVIDPDVYSETVGDFENHFNDWEKDTVYMRNDVDKIDYEIDACLTNYYEMIKVLPYVDGEEEDGPIDG